MPTHVDARLPAHAIAEIDKAKGKQKAALVRWWESWADVGDAKQAERAAFAEVVDTQVGYAECRARLVARHPGQSQPPGACDCGKHAAAMSKAQRERVKAVTAIERAIVKHKAGG